MEKIEQILNKVRKPAGYIGGEYGQISKSENDVKLKIALCFPDTYEIGMSNLGIRILYGVLNGIDGVWCQRVFAPWTDMEEELRNVDIPLFALESHEAIRDFDIIAFSLGYELSYTNMLNMLDLAGIAVRSEERSDTDPIIIAGGSCSYNPLPMSDFVDLFVVGEGEEIAPELVSLYMKSESKADFLLSASKVIGSYVPSVYTENSPPISKRIVKDLDSSFFPTNPIIPSASIVHDRAMIELFRGCRRGCKFCSAGYTTGPFRVRSPEKLKEQGTASLLNSGYDELALLSLSTSDYPHLDELCDSLLEWCEPRKINLSLPSLRADNFSIDLMQRVQKVRKSGLTFAPEAGSQRLRDHINKNITEEELLGACAVAFSGGYNTVKLYFMLGLPTETDDDVIEIANLAHKVLDTWKQHTYNERRGVRLTVSTSCFIPKPHTPFEREGQISISEYLRRVNLLKGAIKSKKITYNYHSPEQGLIEAALSRGDRKLGKVIEIAWRSGAKFDSWSEHFSLDRWLSAFSECGLSPDDYATRERSGDEVLPWSIINVRGGGYD
ncbi:MAG: TIGR03960 family B12-binding radical SAM protein [Oscillospiraceae bacterium]|nr:TIGR03960 family B12-binding radical SAM protein [Oscillospiraceae bacterium]